MSDFNLVKFLEITVPGIVPSGIGRWRFPLDSKVGESAGIQLFPHWVSLSLALPQHRDASTPPMAAIREQSEWPGNAKIVSGHSQLAMRTDVPLFFNTAAERAWVSQQIREAVRGLRAAVGDRPAEILARAVGGCDADPEWLVDRCRMAGLNARINPAGEIHVDIEVRSVPRVVSIMRQTSGLRAQVTLNDGAPEVSEERLAALAHFLLRASSCLRFARAWISHSAASPCEFGFECAIVACAADRPLLAAIDALSAASDLFGCEAEALSQSDSVALRYLQSLQPARRGRPCKSAHFQLFKVYRGPQPRPFLLNPTEKEITT
jgi:hypothetical protein